MRELRNYKVLGKMSRLLDYCKSVFNSWNSNFSPIFLRRRKLLFFNLVSYNVIKPRNLLSFLLNVLLIQGTRTILARVLLNVVVVKWSGKKELWRYEGQRAFDHRAEEIVILVFDEASSQGFYPELVALGKNVSRLFMSS